MSQVMASWVGILLGAFCCIGGVCGLSQDHPTGLTRLLEEDDYFTVGVSFTRGTGSTSELFPSWSSLNGTEDLIANLEQDDAVTVVGDVQVAELMCETLAKAVDAPVLQFAISPHEMVRVVKKSYAEYSGNMFSDGIGRKVWTGVIENSANGSSFPSAVSMTWADGCDLEAFLFKVTTPNWDGSISVISSIPCNAGSSLDICIVQLELNFSNEAEPLNSIDEMDSTSGSGPGHRHLTPRTGWEEKGGPQEVAGMDRRKLTGSTQVSVMYLFSKDGLDVLGISEEQMESVVLDMLSRANEGMTNSKIDMEFNLAYAGQLPYDEGETTTSSSLIDVSENEQVGDLRDKYSADLVQLIGSYTDDSCGRGNVYRSGDNGRAFSNIKGRCIFGHSPLHEMGHNLGCRHNRENAGESLEYAHGYRYCDGEDMYRTVMTYSCSDSFSPIINYFSNPDVDYFGKPTGTPTENCARVIKENKDTVASFRSTADPILLTGDLVEAGSKTTVVSTANAWDDRTSVNSGCDPNGCVASFTRDSVVGNQSRWACKRTSGNDVCKLSFTFEGEQDIASLRIAFYKGNQRKRSFNVAAFDIKNTATEYRFSSSGSTSEFEDFEVKNSKTSYVTITDAPAVDGEWISIFEVEIMVES